MLTCGIEVGAYFDELTLQELIELHDVVSWMIQGNRSKTKALLCQHKGRVFGGLTVTRPRRGVKYVLLLGFITNSTPEVERG